MSSKQNQQRGQAGAKSELADGGGKRSPPGCRGAAPPTGRPRALPAEQRTSLLLLLRAFWIAS
jgi:hypothetical protein